ncbi:MAG TPA: hypothetical protein VLM89_05735 [Phycisphaerae bacterium]|nr:hypothetical protein [Phycisphaerae bacterium]
MMKTRIYAKLVSLLTVGSMLLGSSCLPDNFWAAKWGEIINRGIFGAINAVIGAVTGGGVQI